MTRRLLLIAVLALVTAQPASAHAILLHAEPPNGSILLTAPRYASMTFDSSVRVGPRNAAIRNDGTDVLGGVPHIATGNRLIIPLQSGLKDGDYTVRWSIVSDDGHEEEGVLVFGLGQSSAQPVAALSTRGYVTWQRIVMRTLLLLGVLGAAGAAFFSLAVLGGALPRRQAHLLFFFFLLAFAGADALIHATSAGGTRFGRFMIVAAVAAGIGAAAAALAPLEARLRYVIWAAAAALFVCPTLAGHALDGDQPWLLAPAADLLHLGGAAVWLGGVASLAFARTGTVQRFALFAFPAVLVVAFGGAARALTELASISQLWTTSYGRVLLVKTAVFAVLLALVWLARRRLLLPQLALLAGLAVAVGVLTDLRPGRARATAVRTTPSNVPPQAPAPPAGAYVDAAQAGKLAVGFALFHGKATVTLVGGDGAAVTDVPVHVTSSGRTYDVTVGSKSLRFVVPAKLRSGAALLRRAKRMYEALPAVTIAERLSSGPEHSTSSVFHERAPDRIAYRIVSSTQQGVAGSEAVVIGSRRARWDRKPGGAWKRSSQSPIFVPRTYWGDQARNVSVVGPRELTFYDPETRAWYRVRLAPSGLPAELTMVGAAHFMHHRYSVGSPAISPPSR